MGKRKKSTPLHITEEKRKCLSWNMLDENNQPSSTSPFQIVPNSDIAVEVEDKVAQDVTVDLSSASPVEIDSGSSVVDDTLLSQTLNLHMENCMFYVDIVNSVKQKHGDWYCELGTFTVNIDKDKTLSGLSRVDLPQSRDFKLYSSTIPGEGLLYCESFENDSFGRSKPKVQFWMISIQFPPECLEAVRCPCFQLLWKDYNKETSLLTVSVIALQTAVTKLSYPSEPVGGRLKRQNLAIVTLMSNFYQISPNTFDNMVFNRKHDVDELYDVIKSRHEQRTMTVSTDVQHDALKPLLRPYQKNAISWMLEREKQAVSVEKTDPDALHILYEEVTTADGQRLYYNKYGGILVKERPKVSTTQSGGILAEEMGLGKTVEVLACMLLHPRSSVPKPDPLPILQEKPEPKPEKKTKEKKKKKNQQKNVSDGENVFVGEDSSTTAAEVLNEACHQESSGSPGGGDMEKSIPSTSSSTGLQNPSTIENSSVVEGENNRNDTGTLISSQSSNDLHSYANIEKVSEKTLIDQAQPPFESEPLSQSSNNQSESVQEDSNGSQIQSCSGIMETKDEYIVDTDQISEMTSDLDTGTQLQTSGSLVTDNTQINGSDPAVNGEVYKNIFTEMPLDHQSHFECICGATEPRETKKDQQKHTVQCVVCSLWQHAECVNFDLTDPYRGEFKCPHCVISSSPIQSGATLIISPFSICQQWLDEIRKHIEKKSLHVFMYTGVNKQGFIQPRTLAKQDIVIVTYETLRKELDYVDLPHNNSASGRKLRHPKRFMAIPSPITAVEWWRICLDEAQMVEGTSTKTAVMALRLTAVNRWCVTGTPIQKCVDDLYGLLLFLGVDPFWVQQWWNKLVYKPFCYGITGPLYDLLTSVLWRTAKKDVVSQINIPKQTEEVHWLTFSPVEEHFYRRQYRECVRQSTENLRRWTDSSVRLSNIDRHSVNKLLFPLLRLRQACCHPQVVRGEFLPLHKSTMTMEELLESMTKKAKLEAEESHRQLVAAINGQAGLKIIQEEFLNAVENYREVLRSVDEHEGQLHTDSLQQLHAMYNLHEIISSKPEGLEPTLRDHQLSQQISELKDKYMAKAVAYANSTKEALAPLQQEVHDLTQQLGGEDDWWYDVIDFMVSRGQDDILLQRVRDDLLENRNPEINSMISSARSVQGLQYIIDTNRLALNGAYEKLNKSMKALSKKKPSQDLIIKTVECCLRPVNEILKTCPLCKCEQLFEVYEAKLFSFAERGLVVDNTEADGTGHQVHTRRQGTWANSELEIALRSILSTGRALGADVDVIASGVVHLKLFDAWKKEYKRLRTHWAGLKEHISSFDELDMATTRLRLRFDDEPEPDSPQPNVLDRSELAQHKLKLASDRIIAQNELRKKLGQLIYLKNLAKSQEENPGGDNPDPCPICQTELGKEWSVLQCGHCYCMECVRMLADRGCVGGRARSIRCAVCRQSCHTGEISYVMTKQQKHDADDTQYIRVKGSHSTKVEAVVKCILQINAEDPNAKSLVFSTWTDVLSVVATALTENNVNFKALYTSGKFQTHLSAFKEDENVKVLLLPVHSGANGLNLIEATHVLLVEPILNRAQELQAIGRVHRIGQSRVTKVHRFLIRGTIEQKMHTLLSSMSVRANARDAEENALTIGDLSTLFSQTDRLGEEQGEQEEQGQRISPDVEDTQEQSAAELDNTSGPSVSTRRTSTDLDVVPSVSFSISDTRLPLTHGPSCSTSKEICSNPSDVVTKHSGVISNSRYNSQHQASSSGQTGMIDNETVHRIDDISDNISDNIPVSTARSEADNNCCLHVQKGDNLGSGHTGGQMLFVDLTDPDPDVIVVEDDMTNNSDTIIVEQVGTVTIADDTETSENNTVGEMGANESETKSGQYMKGKTGADFFDVDSDMDDEERMYLEDERIDGYMYSDIEDSVSEECSLYGGSDSSDCEILQDRTENENEDKISVQVPTSSYMTDVVIGDSSSSEEDVTCSAVDLLQDIVVYTVSDEEDSDSQKDDVTIEDSAIKQDEIRNV